MNIEKKVNYEKEWSGRDTENNKISGEEIDHQLEIDTPLSNQAKTSFCLSLSLSKIALSSKVKITHPLLSK